MKEETVDEDEILNVVNEIKLLFEEDKYIFDYFIDLKKDNPDKSEKIEGAFFNYMGENDLKILKTKFPDFKWKYLLKKLAYPTELLNSLHDHQKPVDNSREKDFFSILQNYYPSVEEIKRTKKILNSLILKTEKK